MLFSSLRKLGYILINYVIKIYKHFQDLVVAILLLVNSRAIYALDNLNVASSVAISTDTAQNTDMAYH